MQSISVRARRTAARHADGGGRGSRARRGGGSVRNRSRAAARAAAARNRWPAYLQAPADAVLEAAVEIARTERVALVRRLLPMGVPGVAAFELSIGDAIQALSDEEIGSYFERIMLCA